MIKGCRRIYTKLTRLLKNTLDIKSTREFNNGFFIEGRVDNIPVDIIVRDIAPSLVFVEVSTWEKTERCTLEVTEDITEVVADRIRYCILCLT